MVSVHTHTNIQEELRTTSRNYNDFHMVQEMNMKWELVKMPHDEIPPRLPGAPWFSTFVNVLYLHGMFLPGVGYQVQVELVPRASSQVFLCSP